MKNEKELINDIKEYLDKGIDELDPETLSKIRNARLNALDQARRGWILRHIPVGWVAASILLIVIAATLLTTNHSKHGSSLVKRVEKNDVTTESKVVAEQTLIAKKKPVESAGNEMEIGPDQIALIEMLADENEVDLYENIEFYTWIAEETGSSG